MATHSSVPAWKISWTEEPSGIQSVGSQESDKKHIHKSQEIFGGNICNEGKVQQDKKERTVDEVWSFCNDGPRSPYHKNIVSK